MRRRQRSTMCASVAGDPEPRGAPLPKKPSAPNGCGSPKPNEKGSKSLPKPRRSAFVDSSDKLTPMAHGDSADGLRAQAAACRRLSLQSRTPAGAKALEVLGDQFDGQALKLDPSSVRR
jgi:hypothetical protein